jgi:hypothetical protein
MNRLHVSLTAICLCSIFSGCAKQPAEETSRTLSGAFFVQPSQQPLWFEFQKDSVRQIRAPAEASLNSFEPWSFMPHATGMLPVGNSLNIPVNRIGFYALTLEDRGTDGLLVAVKKTVNMADFALYTVSEPFILNSLPTVLLTNRDIWSSTPANAPKKRAWSYSTAHENALNVAIPAFSSVPSEDGWEIRNFFVTTQRMWYFSAARHTEAEPALRFFRTPTLEDPDKTEEIPPTAFSVAHEAADYRNAPPVLRSIFGEIGEQAEQKSAVFKIFSPEFGGMALFSIGNPENAIEYFGCYAEGETPRALIVSSTGLLYETAQKTALRRLPALPEGFVWTAAGFLGPVVVAAWEERETWHIGSAGLVFLVY